MGAAPLKAGQAKINWGQALRGLSVSGIETPWSGTRLTYFFCEDLLEDIKRGVWPLLGQANQLWFDVEKT